MALREGLVFAKTRDLRVATVDSDYWPVRAATSTTPPVRIQDIIIDIRRLLIGRLAVDLAHLFFVRETRLLAEWPRKLLITAIIIGFWSIHLVLNSPLEVIKLPFD